MSANDLIKMFLERGCLPHQAEFAAKFLEPDSARKHLLLGAPGLGKGFAGAFIVGQAFANKQANRILVLCPSALVNQWHETIRQCNAEYPVLVVDRLRFRELDARRADGDSPWPASGVVVLSIDFAKQADVAASLVTTVWDLLVVDEAHNVKAPSNRYELVSELLNSSQNMRSLFLQPVGTASGSEVDPTSGSFLSGATVTVWSRETVKDRDGKPLLPEVRIEWVRHQRKPDEMTVLAKLQESLHTLTVANPAMRATAAALLQCESSSLFALEQRLNRICQWRNEITHGSVVDDEGELEMQEAVQYGAGAVDIEDQSVWQVPLATMAKHLLPMVDDVESDFKFEVLLGLLESIGLQNSGNRRVCVFTRYADTASYLEAALSERHPHVAKLVGTSSYLDRVQILQEFARIGGVLIVTESMSSTIPEVAGVIFYDLPLNPSVLDERIGQFVRVGRQGPVRVFAFTDDSNALVTQNPAKL